MRGLSATFVSIVILLHVVRIEMRCTKINATYLCRANSHVKPMDMPCVNKLCGEGIEKCCNVRTPAPTAIPVLFTTVSTAAARTSTRSAAAVGTTVYFAPYNEDNVGVLDTATKTFSKISTAAAGVTADAKYYGAVAVVPCSSDTPSGYCPSDEVCNQVVCEAASIPWWVFALLAMLVITAALLAYFGCCRLQAPRDQEHPSKIELEAHVCQNVIPSANEEASTGTGKERLRNRWGDGLDAPCAGRRDFYPVGWTPSKDVFESIKVFGHKTSDLDHLKTKGEDLLVEMRLLELANSCAAHISAIFAYTQENEYKVYSNLNHACRTPGGTAEKKLRLYRDYLYHLEKASSTLPNYVGRVYRGTDALMNPGSYVEGETVTWQQFSSSSKKQHVARKFLSVFGSAITGTLFIMDVNAGKEIELLSEFPDEEEILLKPNSFFKVVRKLQNETEKKAELADLAGYDMTNLEVYILREL